MEEFKEFENLNKPKGKKMSIKAKYILIRGVCFFGMPYAILTLLTQKFIFGEHIILVRIITHFLMSSLFGAFMGRCFYDFYLLDQYRNNKKP